MDQIRVWLKSGELARERAEAAARLGCEVAICALQRPSAVSLPWVEVLDRDELLPWAWSVLRRLLDAGEKIQLAPLPWELLDPTQAALSMISRGLKGGVGPNELSPMIARLCHANASCRWSIDRGPVKPLIFLLMAIRAEDQSALGGYARKFSEHILDAWGVGGFQLRLAEQARQREELVSLLLSPRQPRPESAPAARLHGP